MTSTIGIEDARKRLGDLVRATQQGASVTLTRNGRPVARLIPYQEDPMPTTTTTTYGAEYGYDVQNDGILAYINGADYSDDHATKVSEALFSALQGEVGKRLPEGVEWLPRIPTFIHPVDMELPSREDMAELFREAWAAVESRYEQIESAAVA